jgi:tetratricopeptide (TPR) repeat protein
LLGWKNDFEINLDTMQERLAIPAVSRDLAELDLDSAEKILSCYVADHRTLNEWLGEGELNTEDNPVLEFEVPKELYRHSQIVDNLQPMIDRGNDVMHYATGKPETVEAMRESLKKWNAAAKHVLEGHQHYRQLDNGLATDSYMKALEICPEDDSIEALLNYRDLRWFADDGRRADKALELGQLFKRQGRHDKALSYLNRFVYAEPQSLKDWPKEAVKDWSEWRETAIREAADIHRLEGRDEMAASVLALLDK